MSRTLRTQPKRAFRHPWSGVGGKARGISKLKRKYARRNRRYQDRQQTASENPVIEQPKKIRNFWWDWF